MLFKNILRNFIFFSIFLFAPKLVNAQALLPGNISSCGELMAPGTYTLTQNVSGGSSACFIIGSDNVILDGAGYTISGTGDVAIDARVRTGGPSSPLTEGAHAYTNLLINYVTITGYTTGINISGNDDSSGSGVLSGYGGDGGDVAIQYSTVGSVYSDGGDSVTYSYGGLGGGISFSGTNINISNSTISALGGMGTSNRGTNGGLTLDYTGTLTKTNVLFSAFSYFDNNTTEYGIYAGGTWPMVPGNISTCGTLYGAGTYTLTKNLTASSTCFIISTNNITIDGAGYSVTANDASSTAFAIFADTYASTTIASTTFTNFNNLINSSSSVIISGHNLDLSGKHIAASSLTISYTGTFNYTDLSFTTLSDLTINSISYGPRVAAAAPTLPGTDWTQKISSGSRTWYAITSSSDGTKLAAANYGGYIYTSSDSGLTWSTSTAAGSRSWQSIDSSADGTKLAAVVNNGYVYTSTNGGITWIEQRGSGIRNWGYISSSSDGTKLAAVVGGGGYIYTSEDGGVTWNERKNSGSRYWSSISMSSDGTKLAAVVWSGYIYTSSDGGSTWVSRGSSKDWNKITSSSDGTKLVATTYGGYIYTSSDGGATWTERPSAGSRYWYSITSSSDGTKLAAVAYSGYIYTSIDSGITWIERKELGVKGWYSVASSEDGNDLVAVAYSDYIYISKNPFPEIGITINKPTSSIDSWSPNITWNSATHCYYSFDNWASTTELDCDLAGSDIPNPGYGEHTLYVRALDDLGNSFEKDITFNKTLSIKISNISSNTNISSWSPIIDWDPDNVGNITDCYYSYNNWTSTSTADCSLNGSDILPPVSVGTTTLSLKVKNSNSEIGYNSLIFVYDSGVSQTQSGSRQWYAISSSADGMKLAAVVRNGYIYTSADGGATWIERTSAGSRWWESVDMSDDGTNIIASVWAYGGYIYTSSDGGSTWVARTGPGIRNGWNVVTSSSDGTKLAAAYSDDVGNTSGYIYTSTTSGATWVERTSAGARIWTGLTSSADGTRLAATAKDGYIYTSTTSGATWATSTGAGSRNWYAITSSSDGTKLIATVYGGYVYASDDGGLTWVEKTNLGSKYWASATMSSNGNRIAVAAPGDYIYISEDGGNNWKQIGLSKSWAGVTYSSDGARLAAVASNESVYTFSFESSLSIINPVPGSSKLYKTWSALVNWGSAVECYYSYDNWNSTSTANCLSNGFDITAPLTKGIVTLYVRALDSLGVYTSRNTSFFFDSRTWIPKEGIRAWYAITSSLDGKKLAAVDNSGYIYTSLNSGENWFSSAAGGVKNWYDIASSDDGTKLAAVVAGGYIYTSQNFGSSWATSTGAGSRTWYSITSSSDGTKLAAVANNDYIYTSTTSGSTWATSTGAGSRTWYSITSSSDGNKLAAVVANGYIYTSTTSGATWVERTSAGSRNWSSITSSRDGTNLVAAVTNGYIYTSTTSGATWVERTNLGVRNWTAVKYSPDGNIIFVTASNSYIYESTDGGVSWVQSGDSGSRTWSDIATSYDGKSVFALGYNNNIYVSHLLPVISSPVPDSVLSTWSPGVDWSSSINCKYSYDNLSWSDADCNSDGSDISVPQNSGINTLYIKGTDFQGTVSTSSVSFSYLTSLSNNISYCGSINSPGTYNLNSDITNVYGTCFIVNANNVTINGNGHTITAVGGNNNYAISTGDYGNLTIQNLTFSGFGSGLTSSNSSITYTGTNVDLSNSTSTVGSLTINYTSALTTLNTYISNLASFIINGIDFWTYTAGIFSWSEQEISACGTLSSSGIYKLTQNITGVEGTCFNITANYVVINGQDHTISGTEGNTSYAIVATSTSSNSYTGIAVKNLTLTNFSGGIDTRGVDGITGNTAGKKGGNVSAYNVDFSDITTSINTSGGNAFYENNATAAGGNAGNVKVEGSTLNQIIANGGNTVGNLNIGAPNGTLAGGNAGTITNINSTISTISAINGTGYVPGCMDNNYPRYSSLATYNDGSCFNWIGQISSGAMNWRGIASSADGQKLVAAVQNGYIYTSVDAGVTWTLQIGSGSRSWRAVASSADGKKLSAVVTNGYVYTSDDSGVTWTERTSSGSRNWYSITSSADGTKLAAIISINGYVYTSTDSGVTWTGQTASGLRNWRSIASSADGSKLAAVVASGYAYISTNGGVTWATSTNSGSRSWLSIASSADGSKLAAVVSTGYVYTSTNGGTTWATSTNSGSRIWRGIASSADGNKLAAVVSNGYIYTSTNAGDTWTEQTGSGSKNWLSITSSADGSKLAAILSYDYIYTYGDPSSPLTINILTPQSNIGSVWNPIISWSDSDSCYYSYNNWGTTYEVDCDLNGSDIPVPSVDGSNTLSVKGISGSEEDTDSVTFTFSPRFWCGTADSDWNNVNNWYTNRACSISLNNIPGASETAFVVGNTSPIISTPTVLPRTINATGLTGPALNSGIVFAGTASNTSTIIGNVTFNASSYNSGIITGNAILNTDYYSGSIQTGSSLSITSGKTWQGEVQGNVYTSDNTEVTDFIFSGTGSNHGIINADATFGGITFRIGTVNGTVTLTGLSQTISGIVNVTNFIKQSLVRDTLFIVPGSSFNVSGLFTLLGLDANNLLTVRSTIPGTYVNLGINGSSTINYLRIKDIKNTGPTIDVSSKTVFDDGHNSGFTFRNNSTSNNRSFVSNITNRPLTPTERLVIKEEAERAARELNNNNNQSRSSGILKNFIKNTLKPLNFNSTPTFTPLVQNFKPQNIGATVIPSPFRNFQIPNSVQFSILPNNFMTNISKFLFAPVPKTLTDALSNSPKLTSYLASVGISREQDIATLSKSPVQLKETSQQIPGLFIISSGDSMVPSYATYDKSADGLAQLVKTYPNQSLTISLTPQSTGEVYATYLGQRINFTQGTTATGYITTPSNAGRYILKTPSSPIPLLIEVIAPPPPPQQEQPKPVLFKVFDFFRKLFGT